MSCTQASAFLPNVKLGVGYRPSPRSSRLRPSCLSVSAIRRGQNHVGFRTLVCNPSKCRKFDPLVYSPSRNRGFNPVCLAKENSKSESEGFSWESLRNAMGGLKQEENVQDWLKKQMRENESDGGGGDGGRSGGGGDGDGAGGEDDESFSGILDEFLQVVLATLGFIFVYIYLIRGAELTRLARDYIKYLFGSSASMRLRKAMVKWQRFCDKFIVKVETREDWLERAIVATPTWWHKPRKLARLMQSRGEY